MRLLTIVLKSFSAVDFAANTFLGPYRHAPLVDIFLWITALGAGPTIVAIVVVTTALLATTARRSMIRPLWIVYLGMEATVWIVKYAVGRARPEFISAATASSPSFPSGHSAGSIAIYGFLAYILTTHLTERRPRAGVLLVAAGLVAAIGFSRVFLSLHFVTDVIAGYLIGGFWLTTGIVFCRRTHSGR